MRWARRGCVPAQGLSISKKAPEEEHAAGNVEELSPDEVAELEEELEAAQDSAPEPPAPESSAESENPVEPENPPEPENLTD